MVTDVRFFTDSDLSVGLRDLLLKLEQEIGLREPIRMVIAGGMAVHLYTASRVTSDVDAEFSARILIPPDLIVETKDGNMLYLDPNYNSTFALMHEDYLNDAVRVGLCTDHIEVFVLSPVDLIISKLARYAGPDPEDIETLLQYCRISAEQVQQRAEEALAGYVGNADRLRGNLKDVLQKARRHAANAP